MRTRLGGSRFRFWRAVATCAAAFAVGWLATRDGRAQGSTPANELSLARYFPRQDLVVYVEFDGIDRHREAWKKTAAARLLTETTTGAMYEESLPRIFDAILSKQ